MKSIIISIIIIISASLLGCEEDFNPNAMLKNDYTVYSILDSRLDKQFVLVQRLYQDESTREKLTGVMVYLSEYTGQTLLLKDTVIKGMENFNVYYLPNYKLKRAITYRLTVVKDSFSRKWSDVYIEPIPSTLSFYVSRGSRSSHIYYTMYLPRSSTNACGIKMFVEYYTNSDSTITCVEVPSGSNVKLRYWDPSLREEETPLWEYPSEEYTPIYPSIGFNDWDSCYTIGKSYLTASFYIDNIFYAIFISGNEPYGVGIKRLYVVYYTLSVDLYLNLLKTGNEVYSVRLDEPFFFTNFKSNREAGYGYLGAITTDTLSFKLYPYYIFNKFRYDDQ
jgi:hypothetical protein